MTPENKNVSRFVSATPTNKSSWKDYKISDNDLVHCALLKCSAHCTSSIEAGTGWGVVKCVANRDYDNKESVGHPPNVYRSPRQRNSTFACSPLTLKTTRPLTQSQCSPCILVPNTHVHLQGKLSILPCIYKTAREQAVLVHYTVVVYLHMHR